MFLYLKNNRIKKIVLPRSLVSKLRRLEKEIFLLKKEEDWQNEEELSSEIRSLEKQVKNKFN